MILNVLVESAARSVVLALAVGCGLWIVRARSARLQMTAWTLVLAAALLMPFLIRWRTIEVHPPRRVAATVPVLVRTFSVARVAPSPAPTSSPIDWRAVCLRGYVAVGAVLLCRLLTGLCLTFLLWRRARRVPEPWAVAFDARESENIGAPVTFGSSILLPVSWRDWDALKLRAVVAHESAHVVWGDFFVQLAGKLHVAIFWFSPMAWWLQNRLIHLAEAASDDAALETVANRASYAEILLGLAQKAGHPSTAVAMARPATVKQRVERILSGAALPANPDWRRYVQVAAIVLAVAAVVAGSSIRAQQEPATPSAPARSGVPAEAAPFPESIEVHSEPAAARKTGEAWAIVSGGKITIGGFQKDAADAERRAGTFRNRGSGDYLWFRRGGKDYLITDPETVKRAEDILRHQKEQADTAYRVAIMTRLAEQQALLAQTDDEAGAQLPLVTGELQAVLAAEQQLRLEKSSDLLSREQLRKLEDELRLAKEKGLSSDALHRLEEEVSKAQAKMSGNLVGEIAKLESRTSELQGRLAELESRVNEKQSLLDQKLLWDKQLHELTSQLDSQGVQTATDVASELRQLLDDCRRNGLEHPAH